MTTGSEGLGGSRQRVSPARALRQQPPWPQERPVWLERGEDTHRRGSRQKQAGRDVSPNLSPNISKEFYKSCISIFRLTYNFFCLLHRKHLQIMQHPVLYTC